ncbi:hypothetical protein BB778_12155 [Pluralibacter gergoviae]|uniref:fimbrial protein n=1 Tax=Pluralibacter gergoviae TaxID=61647 RepID=UPI0008DC12E1|nr:fimbrial protein [Pluralibacter gergoviae]OHY68913.1 hypothetical protein BB778_12155 [Pluralibacter gergoviae]
MKVSACAIAILSGVVFAGTAAAAKDEGHGIIHFKGAIIDAPCSINPDSEEQTVKLGAISCATLINSGTSTPTSFSINLEKCALTTAKNVEITFTGIGTESNPDQLGISGSAKGATIALTDAAGTPIKLGTAYSAPALHDGSNQLRFAAYLQGDGSSAVTPGDFTSIANFTLAYN